MHIGKINNPVVTVDIFHIGGLAGHDVAVVTESLKVEWEKEVNLVLGCGYLSVYQQR